MSPRLLLSVEETAEACGIGRTTVYELVKRGDLELVHIGKRSLVPIDSLERYVTRLRAERVTGS